MKLSDLDWLDNIYKSINLENLPHGIIINGPKGIGKEIFAKELASELLLNKNTLLQDCDLLDANNHPDYFILQKDKILHHHITFRRGIYPKNKISRGTKIVAEDLIYLRPLEGTDAREYKKVVGSIALKDIEPLDEMVLNKNYSY